MQESGAINRDPCPRFKLRRQQHRVTGESVQPYFTTQCGVIFDDEQTGDIVITTDDSG